MVGVESGHGWVESLVKMWAMMWATMMSRLMVDNGGVDGGGQKRGVDDGIALCLSGLGEYLRPELLARKSRHCLILSTTFFTVSIVLLVVWCTHGWAKK